MPNTEFRKRNKILSAAEESYFEEVNRKALARLAARKNEENKPRLSPITGEPMVEEVISGVIIDRCPKSNGVWLDAGELEQLLEIAKKEAESESSGWFEKFVLGVKKED